MYQRHSLSNSRPGRRKHNLRNPPPRRTGDSNHRSWHPLPPKSGSRAPQTGLCRWPVRRNLGTLVRAWPQLGCPPSCEPCSPDWNMCRSHSLSSSSGHPRKRSPGNPTSGRKPSNTPLGSKQTTAPTCRQPDPCPVRQLGSQHRGAWCG